MWNLLAFADGQSRSENIIRMKSWLLSLPNDIPQIISWEVGCNLNDQEDAYDIILISTFDSLDDLKIYQGHEAHLNAKDKIRKVRLNRKFVDYNI